MILKTPRFAMVTDKNNKTRFVGIINGKLSMSQGLTIKDFSVVGGMSPSTVSKSIKELIDKGYLLDYRKGSKNYEATK